MSYREAPSYAEPEDGYTAKAARAAGPITAAVKHAHGELRNVEEGVALLRDRLGVALDQRERPSVPGAPVDELPASCELGLELQELGRRLRRVRHDLAELAERIEL